MATDAGVNICGDDYETINKTRSIHIKEIERWSIFMPLIHSSNMRNALVGVPLVSMYNMVGVYDHAQIPKNAGLSINEAKSRSNIAEAIHQKMHKKLDDHYYCLRDALSSYFILRPRARLTARKRKKGNCLLRLDTIYQRSVVRTHDSRVTNRVREPRRWMSTTTSMAKFGQVMVVSLGAFLGGAAGFYLLEVYKMKAKEQRLAMLLERKKDLEKHRDGA
ncbi:hypothetical protein BC938DRAFT_472281 [Jimgerdemannia flammicorona]|uniref:Uncharacterized protein n=1 Tax=Jimgerdemannia flammicorona TaxID=994334 RepID=A0A433Q6G4_9FUNG|nr:hypothetical protein BC938DRAFT_472281 [Jimgerdemannia flammicorona]